MCEEKNIYDTEAGCGLFSLLLMFLFQLQQDAYQAPSLQLLVDFAK